ncbi:FHA domain-containing serine/threonine-protein kinase [Paludisphaera borealis]|uniref:non-specific serine/threonine protein kinase n=1 Tax=Paludisphaera borealis TaxID=1387353 RepID=A0A1U7CQ57_9BACT|nr:FHA domain-containing serine/threonine-protein kinase [Paludisphaera borealis]APW61075.1 Serine/threonine-protein kinase pkn6 [Paludisphaera borealis]MDR3620025.1 serine/threonine-protein kinase [Paludisphaera borealis]
MRVILEVLQGPRAGRSFIFDRHDTFIVGRSRFVHCPIEDMALSRDHFMIEVNPPQCELRDLESTNGTFVNNARTDRARLISGDVIAAGQSIFRVRVEHAPPASGEPPASSNSELATHGQIRCTGCGTNAPLNITVAGPAQTGSLDKIEWWCSSCRSEAAVLPQPVPHYTTLRELGKGAMGVVYQARHNTTGKLVALKLIVPETATTQAAIDRFLREMSVISQLRHPNIVEWYEQGMTRGQFWFAMEFVAGDNLEALAKSTPNGYPTEQACRLTCQILKGLDQAHRLGFVHRDIKPENVLIAHNPEGMTAKISDFGLAKSFRGVGLSGLTFSGEMRGTVPFMPPEQMRDFKTVTPLADLYATAATLYYLLTCQYIYDEPAGGGDLIRMLLEEEPVPVRSRRPDIPVGLATVISKCLTREPSERYPDASSMRRALKPFC